MHITLMLQASMYVNDRIAASEKNSKDLQDFWI